MKFRVTAILAILITFHVKAQHEDDFYNPGMVSEIRIVFAEQNWKDILDSLFTHYGDSLRLIGDITINGKSFKDAGIRYKGYSSWNNDVVKNPFNIDLDYRYPEQQYQGYTKLKLSNVIHDPSFIREVLAYEIAGNYMPAPSAGFVRLFINEEFIGLYTNVEAVDKNFTEKWYRTRDGSFFKGEPGTLIYPFGQNANLSYAHGVDSSGYLPYYKLESEYGWNDLVSLIRVLNTASDSLEYLLNIDRTLWMHAFNYALLNLDSYIGYAQNYYLYKDPSGRFNPVIWDLNMSFGSFRESDGSTNFLGVTIPKLKTLDPLQHMKFSISPRPLLRNLLENDTLRKMYLAHLRTIMQDHILSGKLYERVKQVQATIKEDVEQDVNKFYSYEDFLKNADSTVGGIGSMILYPGIKDLMNSRFEYLSGFTGFDGYPDILEIKSFPEIPVKGQLVTLTATISGADEALMGYRSSGNDLFQKMSMRDDGMSGDGEKGDGIFGATILVSGKTLQYFIYAQNDSAGVFSPARAEYEYHTLQPQIQPGDLVINEICIDPEEDIETDEGWIEILNTTKEELVLSGLSISIGEGGNGHLIIPDTILMPGNYMVISWNQGDNQFLADMGEGTILTLLNSSLNRVDSWNMTANIPAFSSGRYPNGYGPFMLMKPTPGENNLTGITPSVGLHLFPNPASDQVTVDFNHPMMPFTIELYSPTGQQCFGYSENSIPLTQQAVVLSLDVSGYKGLFLVRLCYGDTRICKKLIIY